MYLSKSNIISKKTVTILLAYFLAAFICLIPLSPVRASLISTADTISNPRLSFRSQVVSTANFGTAAVTIGSGQSDVNTSNLFENDRICFTDSGIGGCKGGLSYIVGPISDQNGTNIKLNSSLTTPLLSGDVAMVVQSAVHTITFTTVSSVNNPIIQIRIPAATQTPSSNDGFPDFGSSVVSSGFDLGGVIAGDVVCNAPGPSWVSSVTSSASSGGNYHIITCAGAGTLSASQAVIITIGSAHKLINPAPLTSGHIKGRSDVYGITIRELDGEGNLIDSTTVKVGPVEGVVVSATVPNTLIFSISGVNPGQSCGKTLSVGTTASTVPFSKISAGTFFNAAQQLSVSTNASDGYSVTVQENGPLSIDGLGGTTVPDTSCPANNCSTVTPADWTSSESSGFGYSLQNISGSDASFQYNDLSRNFNAKPFDSVTARTVMTNNGPVDGSSVNTCYQIAASSNQQAGNYFNQLTYVATPLF